MLDDEQLVSLEAGKLHSQQIAVARTSPDGRTRSVIYRTRQMFAPLPTAHGNAPDGFQPMSPYHTPTGFPAPTYSSEFTPAPSSTVPRPR